LASYDMKRATPTNGTQKRKRTPTSSRRGIALLMTLAAIVLLSGVVVVFLSEALANRQLSNSSVNSIKADRLAEYASQFVLGEMRQEMVDGSLTHDVAGNDILQPSTPADAAPAKQGVDSPDTIGAYTIVKNSASGLALRPSGTQTASGVSVSTRSLNGRSISQSRWFGTGGPRLGSQNTLPTWFYVTRDSGVKTPAVDDASQPTNADFVLGRFACTVYDVGGLLNVNVAGYPTVATANAENKGSTAYADLSVLDAALGTPPGPSEDTPQDAFIKWRNGTAATASAEAYADFLAEALERGPDEVDVAQNLILNRGDLLKAVEEQEIGLTAGLLPYLTHGNRYSVAPSWQPENIADANLTYGDDANDVNAPNRFVPNVRFTSDTPAVVHYKDDGTTETYAADAGEPLVTRRFSLAKLAWIGRDGPVEEAFDSSLNDSERKTAIRACFGLEWDETNFRWNYVETTPTPQSIKTLEQVAAENREPNFFELLKAGILSGSIAQHPGEVVGENDEFLQESQTPEPQHDVVGATGPFFFDEDGNQPSYSNEPNLHLVQIGANLIDQADEDSFPTAIYFPAYAADDDAGLYEFYNIAYGVENLPVLNRLYIMGFEYSNSDWPTPEATWDTATSYRFYLIPELWNPHQEPLAGAPSGPQNFRLRAHGQIYGRFEPPLLRKAIGEGDPDTEPQGSTIDYDSEEHEAFRHIYFGDKADFRAEPVVMNIDLLDTTVESTDQINYWKNTLPDHTLFNGSLSADTQYGYFKFAGFYAGSTRWPKDPDTKPWKRDQEVERDKDNKPIEDDDGNTIPVFDDDGNPVLVGASNYFINNQLLTDPMMAITLEVWDDDSDRWLPYSVAPRIATKPAYSNHGCNLDDVPLPYDGALTIKGRDTMFTPDPRTDRMAAGFARQQNGNIDGTADKWGYAGLAEFVKSGTAVQLAIEQYYPREDEFFQYPGCTLSPTTFQSRANTSQWMVNLVDNPHATNGYNAYYADQDGVVRPADGFRRIDDEGDGIYQLKSSDLTDSAERRRPVILNRPFRSVGEMGFAYRDLPGKNLDFWSVKSADAALLDLFSVTDTPRTSASGINLSSAPPKVIESMLANSLLIELSSGKTLLDATQAADIATAIGNHLADDTAEAFENRADLVTVLGDVINASLPAEDGIQANKALAEAPVRALAEVTSTRTWNLLLDVVAQTGRVPSTAESLGDFVVEGERRVWVHVTIDRMTGEVLSYQEEPHND